MIPFTTFCVQGQASFGGGGYAGKNNIFPLFRKPLPLLRLLPCLLPQLPPGMGQGCQGPRWVPIPTVGQSHGVAWGPTGRLPARHGERGQGRKANIIRKDKDEKQTEQPSLALNKYSVEIQKPR